MDLLFDNQIPQDTQVKHYILEANLQKEINFTHSRRILQFSQYSNINSQTKTMLMDSLDICTKTIDKCVKSNYAFHIGLPFNGGKEATLVFHIARAALFQYCITNNLEVLETYLKIFHIFFVYRSQQLKEVIQYIKWAQNEYNFTYNVYSNKSFSRCLDYAHQKYNLEYCFLGIRYSDPQATGKIMYPTKGFPNIIRVNPVFSYNVSEVFEVLLGLNLQYCPLYDKGYSSIGDKETTVQNERLKCNSAISQRIITALENGEPFQSEETQHSILGELINRGLNPRSVIDHIDPQSEYLPSFMLNTSDTNDRRGRTSNQ